MSDGHDQEHAMGYKCPSCGTVGSHTRTRFGPPNDGRNLERYCCECNKKFLTSEAEFVNKLEDRSGGDTLFSKQAGNEDNGDACTQDEDKDLPTAAYEVWCMEDGEEKMELMRNLPEKATVNNEIVRRSDAEYYAGIQFVRGEERERQRITELIEEMKQEVKGTRLHSADIIEAFNELLDEVEQQ